MAAISEESSRIAKLAVDSDDVLDDMAKRMGIYLPVPAVQYRHIPAIALSFPYPQICHRSYIRSYHP